MSDKKSLAAPQFDENALGSFADFYDELEAELLFDPELAIQRDFMRYGERVRNLRKQMGYSQAKLAKESGLRQAQISDIENGVMKDGPTQRSMLKLSYALKAPDLAGLEPAETAVMVKTVELGEGVQMYVDRSEQTEETDDALIQWKEGVRAPKRYRAKSTLPPKAPTLFHPGDTLIIKGAEEAGFAAAQLSGGIMKLTTDPEALEKNVKAFLDIASPKKQPEKAKPGRMKRTHSQARKPMTR